MEEQEQEREPVRFPSLDPSARNADDEDPFARSGAPPFMVDAAPTPLRVGVPEGPIPFFGDKDYEALYHASIDRLAALGAGIVPIDFTPFARAASMLYAGPSVAERLVAIGDLATQNPQAIHEVVRGIILKGVGVEALWPEIVALSIFAVVIMGGAALRFRKRLD